MQCSILKDENIDEHVDANEKLTLTLTLTLTKTRAEGG